MVARFHPLLSLRWLGLVAGCALLSGCAISTGGAANVPRCTPAGAGAKVKIWVGEQAGDFNQTNRQRAVSEALQTGLSELGFSISSTATLKSRSVTESSTGSEWKETFIEDSQREVELKLAETEIRGAKVAYCINQRKAVEARVTLSVAEWHRIRRQKLGTTVVMLQCSAPVPRHCQRPKIHSLLRKAVVEAGLKPLSVLEPEETMSPNSPKANKRLGVHNDAAYILWVSMEGRNLCGTGACKQAEVFAAVTSASLTLVDTRDGKAIHSWSSPSDCSYKSLVPSGMHYTFKDALRKSMDGAVSGTDGCGAGIQAGLGGWKESAKP